MKPVKSRRRVPVRFRRVVALTLIFDTRDEGEKAVLSYLTQKSTASRRQRAINLMILGNKARTSDIASPSSATPERKQP